MFLLCFKSNKRTSFWGGFEEIAEMGMIHKGSYFCFSSFWGEVGKQSVAGNAT